MPDDKHKEDERFGKARNEEPPDPFHDSTSIAKEPPRRDQMLRAEEEAEEEAKHPESGGKHERLGRDET
jgi:hypothetical protein